MVTTNLPLSRTLAGRGSLLCKLGPIHVVSFYLITRHNSSLERLPTKAKEDPSPHEMRLSPAGHQTSISWSWGNSSSSSYYYYDHYYHHHHHHHHHHHRYY